MVAFNGDLAPTCSLIAFEAYQEAGAMAPSCDEALPDQEHHTKDADCFTTAAVYLLCNAHWNCTRWRRGGGGVCLS